MKPFYFRGLEHDLNLKLQASSNTKYELYEAILFSDTKSNKIIRLNK